MTKNAIQLSDHFGYRKLLRFSLPSIAMMMFTSIYGVVDGFFISNYVGETAFAAVNLILPYCMAFGAIGSLFGVGGSALVAFVRGQGDEVRANRIFSLLVYSMIAVGLVTELVSQLLLTRAAVLLGANEQLFPICIRYGRLFLLTQPAFILQFAFQSFLINAERPKLGLLFTFSAGVGNMILDGLLVGVLGLGVEGAAAATCAGQCVGGIGPLLFFVFTRNSPLKLGKTSFMPRELLKSASNGIADFITNLAMSVVNMVFNLQLMKYIGEYGVSAYGIIMYVSFIFISVFLGFSMGVSPVFSFHYGAGNYDELKGLFRRCILLMICFSFGLAGAAELSAKGLASLFASYDAAFLALSTRALRIYFIGYFFAGIGVFGSCLFAALNNGPLSGILSAMRLFVFQLSAVFLLPCAFGSDGIWLAVPVSEVCVMILTVLVFIRNKNKYHYA